MREASSRTIRLLLCGTLVACGGTQPITPESSVAFSLDAPFCGGMILPVRFSIDGALVGIDTFRVTALDRHTTTRAFPTTAGKHVLNFQSRYSSAWPDTTVTLRPGMAVTDTLSFYCS